MKFATRYRGNETYGKFQLLDGIGRDKKEKERAYRSGNNTFAIRVEYSSILKRCSMGRCGGWIQGMTLFLAVLAISCGDTGNNKPSSTGRPFVFQARGRLNLAVQVDPKDPKFLYITATLLDPQGNPLGGQRVTFEAEFPDAIFIPADLTDPLACLNQSGTDNATRCTNRGAAITDDKGQAKITLFSIVGPNTAPRNPDRLMRVTAEAPNSLDIASSISVPFTALGFLIGGDLSITPPAVTFVNPLVDPAKGNGPTATFSVQGGRPPYRWDNQNKNLGKLTPTSPPTAFDQQFVYTIIGGFPGGSLTDTITVTDAAGKTATATVTVVFADCTLKADKKTIKIDAASGGETFSVRVSDGVPPFTVTEDFPGTLAIGSPQTLCDSSQKDCSLLFTLATPARGVNPDSIIIRDARGCTAEVSLTVGLCGNGRIDAAGEECDAPDFAGLTCSILKGAGAGGILRCSSECKLDDSKCTAPPIPPPLPAPLCGNGTLNGGEQCDGTTFASGATCASVLGDPAAVGFLQCTSACSFDTSFCRIQPPPPLCGNGTLDGGEQCDGTTFASGATCASVLKNGTAVGFLQCTSSCSFDTRFCRIPPP